MGRFKKYIILRNSVFIGLGCGLSTNIFKASQDDFSQVALVVKNLPDNAGDVRHTGSILGSGKSPGGGVSNPL